MYTAFISQFQNILYVLLINIKRLYRFMRNSLHKTSNHHHLITLENSSVAHFMFLNRSTSGSALGSFRVFAFCSSMKQLFKF